MTGKLKPCPFCGADAVLTEHEPHDHSPCLVALTGIPAKHPGSWTVECVACSCGMIHGTREEVEAAWNRRALSASIADTAGAKPIGEVKYALDMNGGGYFATVKWLDNTAIEEGALLYLAAPPAPSSDTAKPIAQWQTKLREPILPECDTWINVSEEGARKAIEKWSHVYEVRALVLAAPPAPSVADAAGASELPTRKKLCTGSHIMCEGREYCLGHPSCSELAEKESGND